MEVIQLAGYTEEEKLQIARRYLVPRQIERNGLYQGPDRVHRRGAAGDHRRLHARGRGAPARARDRHDLPQGRPAGRRGSCEAEGHDHRAPRRASCSGSASSSPRHAGGPRARASRPGWPGRRSAARCCSSRRPRLPGPGSLTITGQLGDVMQESAQAALSYVRCLDGLRARTRSCPRTGSRTTTSTSTFPPGATPKDGPSAGVTMVTALASLLSGRPVRSDVAMTGEITLTGQVLPIGGLKEKALAAQRGGIRTVIAPAAQRAGRRRDPRAPAQGPRVRVRLDGRGGARGGAPAPSRAPAPKALRAA